MPTLEDAIEALEDYHSQHGENYYKFNVYRASATITIARTDMVVDVNVEYLPTDGDTYDDDVGTHKTYRQKITLNWAASGNVSVAQGYRHSQLVGEAIRLATDLESKIPKEITLCIETIEQKRKNETRRGQQAIFTAIEILGLTKGLRVGKPKSFPCSQDSLPDVDTFQFSMDGKDYQAKKQLTYIIVERLK